MTKDLRPFGNPGSDQFRLDAYPFYLLNRAVSRYNVVIDSQLRPIGIDIPTWRVLMILGEQEPLAIGQVAKSAVINLSTMMRIVERMSRAELIAATPSQSDGRVTEIGLTPHGREKLEMARAAMAPLYERIIAGFSADEFAMTLDVLKRLHDNLA